MPPKEHSEHLLRGNNKKYLHKFCEENLNIHYGQMEGAKLASKVDFIKSHG